MRPRGSRASKGFTLSELLIVIIIIAILAALIIPSMNHTRHPSRRSMCSDNMKQIHYAISMYEQEFGMFPMRPGKDQYSGDAQEALNLLYRQYTDDVRIFSCDSNPLDRAMLNQILPSSSTGWPGAPSTCFKESPPGVRGTSTSYGYSPGHNSTNPRMAILADRQGTGPKGNSDNHGYDVGQNVLSAGGAVQFSSVRSNMVGTDDYGVQIIDSDIFWGNTITPAKYREWDSYCR